VTRFRVLPERSQLMIEAKSDLHPIRGKAERLEGEAEVQVTDGALDLSEPVSGRINLPVERLSSGSQLQDMEMRRRIEAGKFPMIVAELRRVTPRPQPGRFKVQTDLTFHGITRRLESDLTAKLDGDQTLAVEGDLRVDVRGFGVNPPKMLGLQVHPEVQVRFIIVLQS